MSTQVYILGPQFSTFVRSVMLACEEKGISYDYGFQPDGNEIGFKSDDHFALHPFGKIPVLLHGENSVFETASICRYLDEHFPDRPLQPADPTERSQADQWSAAISCYVDQALVRDYLLEFARPKGENGSIRMDKVAEHQPKVIETLQLLEKRLSVRSADQVFFCSAEYSMADAILTPMLDYLSTLPHYGELIANTPLLAAYTVAMQSRTSAKAVLLPLK